MASTTVACPIRDPVSFPPAHEGALMYFDRAQSERWIIIDHPATSVTLFMLPALDGHGDNVGVHYNTVKTMCDIIAGNRWTGVFRNCHDGSLVAVDGEDSLLPPGSYHYFPDVSADSSCKCW
jgi:hypothetical protein